MLRGRSTIGIVVETLSSVMCVQLTIGHDGLSQIRRGQDDGEPTKEQHSRHDVDSESTYSHAVQEVDKTNVGSGRSSKPRECGVGPR